MVANMRVGDPPIILTAQTNHALDQMLRHVSSFDREFIRLGGQTTDLERIRPRTLWEIKQAAPPTSAMKRYQIKAQSSLKAMSTRLSEIMEPIAKNGAPFSADLLHRYGLLTDAHQDSLSVDESRWAVDRDGGAPPMDAWLESELVVFKRRQHAGTLGTEFEEIDEEFEQLREMEAEAGGEQDEAFETLRGTYIGFNEPYTGKVVYGHPDSRVEGLLKAHQDLYGIPLRSRGAVYAYLQRKLKEKIRDRVRELAAHYAAIIERIKIGKWEVDYQYLKSAKIIGMTTTGISKYRGLVSALRPRIVLIEEAAETLEANVASACFESLQHLVLVGDHKQLRAQCAIKEFEGDPWYLNTSLFERLVMNDVEFSQLTRQHRMRPEIRELINPLYEDLQDHPGVRGRENVPGMGGFDTFFFTHSWHETFDHAFSKCNVEEAATVVGFFDYLVHNGLQTHEITVLTFYNAQRKEILKRLRAHRNFQGCRFQVSTVDAYQGEENEIILLSLVRNNRNGDIGFLNVENRVCVALSRARRGLYLFGNDQLLLDVRSKLWTEVLGLLYKRGQVGDSMPCVCTRHSKLTLIKSKLLLPLLWVHLIW